MRLLRRDTKKKLIRSLPVFADCSSREVAEVAAVADEVIFGPGRALTTERATGREFVVIVKGRARVERGGRVVAELRAGDFFGEMALLTGQPRSATVTAVRKVDALVIEEHAFHRLLEHAPSVRAKVEAALAERAAVAV